MSACHRIVVIHDDRDYVGELSAACAAAGFEVASAFDSVQGMQLVRTFAPDLVAAAVRMPGGGAAHVHDFINLIGRVNTRVVYLTDGAKVAPPGKRRPHAVLSRHESLAYMVERFTELLAEARSPKEPAARPQPWRVLIVDDEVEHCARMLDALAASDDRRFDVRCAHSLAEARRRLQVEEFACVLLDHNLPDGRGTELFETSAEQLLGTPVIGISTSGAAESALDSFRCGCVEVVSKADAFAAGVLRQRVTGAIALFEQRVVASTLRRRHLVDATDHNLDVLVAASRIDSLTGLYTRHAFEEYHADLHTRAAAHHSSYALAMIDVDHFKGYNDHYGHPAGDDALRYIARTLRQGSPDDAFLARFGGEEMVLLLERAEIGHALRVADNLRQGVFDGAQPHAHNPPHQRLTVSIGVAVCRGSDGAPAAVIAAADHALYRAKRDGRNRVALDSLAAAA